MTNKAKRNLSFVLFLLSAVIFIVIVFVKRLWNSDSECYMTWQFISSLVCMLFSAAYIVITPDALRTIRNVVTTHKNNFLTEGDSLFVH